MRLLFLLALVFCTVNLFSQIKDPLLVDSIHRNKQKKWVDSLYKEYDINSGIDLLPQDYLSYSDPVSLGFNKQKLYKLDSLANIAIDSMMTPGLQMLVARKGRIVYHKSHGFHTYEKKTSVKNDHVYDIASLTKIIGTLPLVIKSVDNGDFDLNSNLKFLLPELGGSNKENVTVKRIDSSEKSICNKLRLDSICH